MNELNNQSEFYEQNRKLGENETKICELIRKDKIEEFISYATLRNFDLSKGIYTPQNSKSHEIKPRLFGTLRLGFNTKDVSIFESNEFLFNKNPKFIKYTAFFGSIMIFKYLYLQHFQLFSQI